MCRCGRLSAGWICCLCWWTVRQKRHLIQCVDLWYSNNSTFLFHNHSMAWCNMTIQLTFYSHYTRFLSSEYDSCNGIRSLPCSVFHVHHSFLTFFSLKASCLWWTVTKLPNCLYDAPLHASNDEFSTITPCLIHHLLSFIFNLIHYHSYFLSFLSLPLPYIFLTSNRQFGHGSVHIQHFTYCFCSFISNHVPCHSFIHFFFFSPFLSSSLLR